MFEVSTIANRTTFTPSPGSTSDRGMTGARLTLSLLVLATAACAAPKVPVIEAPKAAPAIEEDAPTLRLPTDVHPTRERLSLDVDPTKETFRGVAEIDVHFDRPRSVLWLHGRDLRVTRVAIVRDGHATEARWTDAKNGLASVKTATPFAVGDATLHVEYDATFMPAHVGLYRVERGGQRYAFTQFEEVEARRAFPCFDEPSFKTPFTTTLTIPRDLQAISNTSEDERTPLADGRLRLRFHETAPLPAYLVAFAVGAFDVVRAPDLPPSAARSRPLPLRGIAAKGRGGELAFALARAGAIVAAMEE